MKSAIAVKVLRQGHLWIAVMVLAVVSAPLRAEAQSLEPIRAAASSIPPQVINGLFAPTSAERFFEAGREQLETETDRLLHESPSSEPLLTVDQAALSPTEPPTAAEDQR